MLCFSAPMGGIPVLVLLASLALVADRMATGSGSGVGNSPNGYTPASLKVATLAYGGGWRGNPALPNVEGLRDSGETTWTLPRPVPVPVFLFYYVLGFVIILIALALLALILAKVYRTLSDRTLAPTQQMVDPMMGEEGTAAKTTRSRVEVDQAEDFPYGAIWTHLADSEKVALVEETRTFEMAAHVEDMRDQGLICYAGNTNRPNTRSQSRSTAPPDPPPRYEEVVVEDVDDVVNESPETRPLEPAPLFDWNAIHAEQRARRLGPLPVLRPIEELDDQNESDWDGDEMPPPPPPLFGERFEFNQNIPALPQLTESQLTEGLIDRRPN